MEVVGMLSISPVWDDDLLQAGTDELIKILLTFTTAFKSKGPAAGEMMAQQLKAMLPFQRPGVLFPDPMWWSRIIYHFSPRERSSSF